MWLRPANHSTVLRPSRGLCKCGHILHVSDSHKMKAQQRTKVLFGTKLSGLIINMNKVVLKLRVVKGRECCKPIETTGEKYLSCEKLLPTMNVVKLPLNDASIFMSHACKRSKSKKKLECPMPYLYKCFIVTMFYILQCFIFRIIAGRAAFLDAHLFSFQSATFRVYWANYYNRSTVTTLRAHRQKQSLYIYR